MKKMNPGSYRVAYAGQRRMQDAMRRSAAFVRLYHGIDPAQQDRLMDLATRRVYTLLRVTLCETD